MSEKIKIVLLTDCLVDTKAGAEKQIVELARRLNASRFEVTVVSLEATGKSSEDIRRLLGKPLMVFPVIRIYGLSGLIQGFIFFRFLKKQRIDILQTYHFSSDLWGTFWAKLAGVPVIISNRRDMGFWRGCHHLWAYRMVNPWVSWIVTVADSVKNTIMKAEGVNEHKIKTIHNGVDIGPLSQLNHQGKAAFGLKDQELMIVHIGNLRPIKGHEFLLKAFSEMLVVYPQVKLFLVGEDGRSGEMQKLAEDLKIKDQVVFLGKRSDVPEILAAADICVLPSLSEGMSNAILEYLSAAKPVVATNVGGNPELIKNGYNGLLVKPADVPALRNALLELIKDPNKRLAMGKNGLQLVQSQFSFEQMVAQYEQLYEKALKK